jgi:AcrR family transcriptional regulator
LTRRTVLDAATALFVERGYAATSIDAIAEASGVGRSTVFTAAGGKPWLLKTAYDRAIVGDDEPIPLADRPEARRLEAMTDAREIISAYADIIAAACHRVSALCDVIKVAADSDEEVARLWATIQEERLAGAAHIVALIGARGPLRTGLGTEQARDVVWIFNDPTLHHLLVHTRGWTQDAFRDWLAGVLGRELLG